MVIDKLLKRDLTNTRWIDTHIDPSNPKPVVLNVYIVREDHGTYVVLFNETYGMLGNTHFKKEYFSTAGLFELGITPIKQLKKHKMT